MLINDNLQYKIGCISELVWRIAKIEISAPHGIKQILLVDI